MDKDIRDELIKLAGEFLQEEEIKGIFEEEHIFEEKGKYRNGYEGYSELRLPFLSFYGPGDSPRTPWPWWTYRILTTAVSSGSPPGLETSFQLTGL